MRCDYHKDREAVDVCNNCGRHLCKECHDYKEKYMLCKKCNKEYVTVKYNNLRRGVYLTILSLACAIMLLSMYIFELCLKRATKNFIILGGIFCGILVPFCILFCLFTIINLVKTKNQLIYIDSIEDMPMGANTTKSEDKNDQIKIEQDITKKELQAEVSQKKAKAKQKNQFVPNDLISQKEYDHLRMLMDQQSQNFTAEQLEQYDLKEFEELEKKMNKKKKKKWGLYGV